MTSAWYFKEPLRNETKSFHISKFCFPWLVYTLPPSNSTHYYLTFVTITNQYENYKEIPSWKGNYGEFTYVHRLLTKYCWWIRQLSLASIILPLWFALILAVGHLVNSWYLRSLSGRITEERRQRSPPFPIQRRPLLTSVVLEDISQSPVSRTRSIRSTADNTPDHQIPISPLASTQSATSLDDTNIFDDDSSGSMFEEHFEASSFLEAHSEYDVTYDAIGLNFYSQHNATGHHNSDLFETSYADSGRRPRDQQQQQNHSFTNGLEFGQHGTEQNNWCENDGNEAYNFIRENLGRGSFPLDKASHVNVQNEQMKVPNIDSRDSNLQRTDAISASSVPGTATKCSTPLTCLATWDHVTFDPTELQFKCGDFIENLGNSDQNPIFQNAHHRFNLRHSPSLSCSQVLTEQEKVDHGNVLSQRGGVSQYIREAYVHKERKGHP